MQKQTTEVRWYRFEWDVAARVEPQRFEQVLGAIRREYVAARRAHLEGELRALRNGVAAPRTAPAKAKPPAKAKAPAKATPAPAKAKLVLTRKQLAVRRLQGQYLGALRKVTNTKQRKFARNMAQTQGVANALTWLRLKLR